jgi:hypothetical protein
MSATEKVAVAWALWLAYQPQLLPDCTHQVYEWPGTTVAVKEVDPQPFTHTAMTPEQLLPL